VLSAKTLEPFDEGEGFGELREERFFGLESGGVDTAAESAHAHGMLEVEHLVVEQVFDGVARAGGAVEDFANDDGVVSGVVMAEGTLGVVLAPGEVGPAEQASEKALVQMVEDFFEMEEAAFGAGDALGAAGVADELGLACYSGRGGEALVAKAVGSVDGLFVELGEQDVGDGVKDGLRSAFEQIGEADVDVAFAKADGGVERAWEREAGERDIGVERWGRNRETRNTDYSCQLTVVSCRVTDSSWHHLKGVRRGRGSGERLCAHKRIRRGLCWEPGSRAARTERPL
jgi:hypothetical protein